MKTKSITVYIITIVVSLFIGIYIGNTIDISNKLIKAFGYEYADRLGFDSGIVVGKEREVGRYKLYVFTTIGCRGWISVNEEVYSKAQVGCEISGNLKKKRLGNYIILDDTRLSDLTNIGYLQKDGTVTY